MLANNIGLGLALLSLAIWVGLLGLRGQFWRADQRLEADNGPNSRAISKLSAPYPTVCAVIPARNEADLLPATLRSLLTQDYPGAFAVILVDDHSTDETAAVAQRVAGKLGQSEKLDVIAAEPLPTGWTGKLWALEQGIRRAQQWTPPPDYLLLTDADIKHDSLNLQRLVAKAEQLDLELASVMVLLRCQSFWEQLLIPAFVFFFQKLYPFRWVNDPARKIAAAAGGCILIRRLALNRIGGIRVVRQALIDDCALAQAVKSGTQGISSPTAQQPRRQGVWLGLSAATRSLRSYPSLASIWNMVARTAFTQLNYSPWLLLGTLIGMTVTYLIPPGSVLWGGLTGNRLVASIGLITWLFMAITYWPTLRLYRCSPLLAPCLPAIAFLYTLMTLDSALRHWQGQGGAWKGRIYSRNSQ